MAQLERSESYPTVATLDGILRATGMRLRLVAEPDHPNVDETLIARNLRMTPAERLPPSRPHTGSWPSYGRWQRTAMPPEFRPRRLLAHLTGRGGDLSSSAASP